MSFAGAEDVTFGPFRLSVRERTLSDLDGKLSLKSRAFDVLLTLIESRGAVLSKYELMRRVWGNIVVEENNLHVQIAAVRRALGVERHCILTVPGKGYRFIGDLHAEAGGVDHRAEGDQPEGPVREPPPTNLPARLTPLIGREQELAAASALLDDARLVTLAGPCGVGKTKLAVELARGMLDRFAGGCWLVDLGPAPDAAVATAAVAAALNVDEVQGRPLSEGLVGVIGGREVLIILDGCEHVLETIADLVSRLLHRCPRLRILCTSQAPLGVEGEHVRRVAPFEAPGESDVATAVAAVRYDAMRLFAERAGAGDGRFVLTDANAACVAEICRSLDGLPLAIELAATRAPLLGLEQLRLRVRDRRAFPGDDRRDLPNRHRTLRNANAWSYALLPESDRQILRRLSVFSGGFSWSSALEVAAEAGVEESDIVRGVGTLVRGSLLMTGPDLVQPRFGMLQATRDFAHERLVAAGEHLSVARRHAQHFANLAEEAESVRSESRSFDWQASISPESGNFRAALAWALGPDGDVELGARLAAATARFWFEAGLSGEARNWLARALERAPDPATADRLMDLQRRLAALSVAQAVASLTAEDSHFVRKPPKAPRPSPSRSPAEATGGGRRRPASPNPASWAG